MSSRPERSAFATTRWTMVFAAKRESSTASRALAELCELYWPPLYAYARRRGYPVDDAQDLTQGFFMRLFEKDYVHSADPQRGRFRSFLLASFKHFLANECHRERTQKRGGGWRPITQDAQGAEARYAADIADDMTPERLFEREWARSIVERAHAALGAEYAGAGKSEAFERLKGRLTGEKPVYVEIARELGTSEGALKVRVHRMPPAIP
jgi:RNA polymerase sigma factor (sigma-70 family)